MGQLADSTACRMMRTWQHYCVQQTWMRAELQDLHLLQAATLDCALSR